MQVKHYQAVECVVIYRWIVEAVNLNAQRSLYPEGGFINSALLSDVIKKDRKKNRKMCAKSTADVEKFKENNEKNGLMSKG